MTRSTGKMFRGVFMMITASAAGFIAGAADADDYVWNNPGSGAFEDPANWNDGASGIPGPEDVAIIDASGSPKISFSADQTTDRLMIRTGTVKLFAAGGPVIYTLLNPVGATESVVIGQGGRDLTIVKVIDLTLRGSFATIGKLFDANGTLELYGASALELDSHLRIGDEGIGRLDALSEVALTCGACEIGHAAMSRGELWLAGGASASCAGPLTIGKHGDGELAIADSGTSLSSGDVIIAQLADATGTATLEQAIWTINGTLDVGMNSFGRLEILDDASVSNEIFATIGTYPHFEPGSPGEGVGDVLLDAATWSVHGDLYVGYLSQGNLVVDWATLFVDQDVYVGAFNAAVGTLEINGGDVLADGDFFLGVDAVGETILTAYSVIDVAQDLTVGPEGSLTVSSGTAIADGAVSLDGPCTVADFGLISAGLDITLSPGAALTLSRGGAIMAFGDLVNAGTGQITLELAGADDYAEPAIDVGDDADGLDVTVALVDDFKPSDGDTFAVVHADGSLGNFTFSLPELDQFLAWDILTTEQDIILAVYSTCIPGDATGDGIVDVLDLLAVLNAWGDCPGCPEDLTGDGVVDVLDLLQVLANWSTNP